MKKLTRKLLSVFLAVAMIVTILPPVTAQAAELPKKLTLYVGETYGGWISCESLNGVATTNKSVAAVKAKKASKEFTITPKKAGTATVTIKAKGYFSKKVTASKIKVTVKKPTFSCSIQNLNGGYVLVSVKNTSAAMFDKAELSYSLKDATTGEVVKKDTTTLYKLLAGKTHYERIHVGSSYEIDCDGSTAKVSQVFRYYPENQYKNIASDAVEYKELNVEETDSQIKFDLKLKNTLNKDVTVRYYVIAYDINDTIIDVPCNGYKTLKKKEIDTAKYLYVGTSQYSHPNYDHYKIVVYGCYQTK